MGYFTATRRRRVLASVVATLLVVSASAFAYWLVTDIIGEGEASNKIGTHSAATETVKVNVSFPEIKGPGQPVQFEAGIPYGEVKTEAMLIKRAIVTFTNSRETEGCSDSWFKVGHFNSQAERELFTTGLANPIVIKPGEEGTEYRLSQAGAEIELANEPVPQEACEGATLHVHVKTEA